MKKLAWLPRWIAHYGKVERFLYLRLFRENLVVRTYPSSHVDGTPP